MASREFPEEKTGFATTTIHPGLQSDEYYGGTVLPISTSVTYKLPTPHVVNKVYYSRCGNPTRFALEQTLALLDGGKHGFAFSSGHGAMMNIFSLLSHGDHILSSDDIYSGTSSLFKEVIMRLGIEVTFEDFTSIKNVDNGIKKNTKMIWVETPTNPTLKVIDIAAVVKVAKSHGDIIVGVDNTFLTPYFQKPLDFGADIVMYSLTKFMNGHSDVVMGAAVVNDEGIAKRLASLQTNIGAIPSPMDCYLVSRGLKTLALRMEQHKKSSLIIAKWLLSQDYVVDVYHPGLPSHCQHALANRQSSGHSGIFSFRHSGGLKESESLMCALKVFTLGVSLGGFESLVQLPSTMTHASVPEEIRAKIGITDSLIRVSIGLEDPEDLIKDLDQAFKVTFG